MSVLPTPSTLPSLRVLFIPPGRLRLLPVSAAAHRHVRPGSPGYRVMPGTAPANPTHTYADIAAPRNPNGDKDHAVKPAFLSL